MTNLDCRLERAERSRARWRSAAFAGWILVAAAAACGASSYEQVGKLVVFEQLRVGDDGAKTNVAATPSQIVLVDATGRKLVLTASGVQAFDAKGAVVGALAPSPASAPPAADAGP